jgi:hypothetical protein
MATVFTAKHEPDTRHVTLFGYTATADAVENTLIALGNKVAVLDDDIFTGVNQRISVTINAEFEVNIAADVDGTVTVGAACYLSSAGKITATDAGNTYAGIVTYQDADVMRFAS